MRNVLRALFGDLPNVCRRLGWLGLLLIPFVTARAGINLNTADPTQFFTNVASRLLKSELNMDFGRIEIYPTNQYTPAVHRILQVTANLYDAGGNYQFYGPPGNATNFPSVFRPIFSKVQNGPGLTNYSVIISGYTNIESASSFVQFFANGQGPNTYSYAFVPVFRDLYNPDPAYPLSISKLPTGPMYSGGVPDMVDGVPLIIGARKGFPNFNELSMTHGVQAIRKLEFQRANLNDSPSDPANPVTYTNQLYTYILTNVLAMEAWNPYSNAYPGTLQLIATNDYGVSLYATNAFGQQIVLWSTNVTAICSSNIINWPGWPMQGAEAPLSRQRPSFVVPFTNVLNFTTNIAFNQVAGGFASLVNSGQATEVLVGPGIFPTSEPQFQWWVAHTNHFRYVLVDATANRIVDYVSLVNQDAPIDIVGDLMSGANPTNFLGDQTDGGQWQTNTIGNAVAGVPIGILNQILVGLGQFTPYTGWNSANIFPGYGNDVSKAIQLFNQNLLGLGGTPDANIFIAPYVPIRTILEQISFQANDPFVHYTIGDLTDLTISNSFDLYSVGQILPVLQRVGQPGIGQVNHRYQPWGQTHGGQFTWAAPDIYLQNKDPMVTRSDDWILPTNLFNDLTQIGFVHRGTPWQTIYLKSADVSTNPGDTFWTDWTGDTNFSDAMSMRPVTDWHLASEVVAWLNTNDPTLLLSPNDSDTNAWQQVLGQIVVETNNVTDDELIFTDPPAFATFVMTSNSPQAALITSAILGMRSNLTGGLFQYPGQIFSTSQLAVASPWLNTDEDQVPGGISEAMYEAIPGQLLPRLRADSIGVAVTGNGQVQFSGIDGCSYIVQVSSNLLNWANISTNSPANGVFSFTDMAGLSDRFYRSVLQP